MIPKSQKSKRHILGSEQGMTMIEMIGVLGVIAVLAGMLLPKVFQVVAESKVDALATATQTYGAAVTKYYTDVGTILPLNDQGNPLVENSGDSVNVQSLAARLTLADTSPLVLTTNLWPKFQGPYLERFDSELPPELGTQMFLPASQTISLNTPVTSTNLGWDLQGNDGLNDLATGGHVVYLKLEGIGEKDFLMLDNILDTGIGKNDSERKIRGRAKWDPVQNGTLFLYLADR
jgi:type II secretory pathway pseudopilin PulG